MMCALHLILVMLDCRMVVPMRWVMHHHVLVPNVRWRLLVALVIAEGHRHLMHVQGTVQMVQRVLLKVVVRLRAHIDVHFNTWVTAVRKMLVAFGRYSHVVGE